MNYKTKNVQYKKGNSVENIKWLKELNPITYHFMFEAYLGITLHFH